MGTDLVAFRKTKVQIEKRDDNNDDDVLVKREYIDSFCIWKIWRDSDVNSWPKCLQYFWWHIHDYDSAEYYTKKIREYYPNDKELIIFASWLETFDEEVIFELSI